MKRLRLLSPSLAIPALAATLAAGCTEPLPTDTGPTIVRTVVETTPGIVDIVQGETFTINAWREWSDGSRSAPDIDVFSLPAGLVQVGTRTRNSTLTSLTFRGVEPLDVVLTLTDNTVPLEEGVPVEVRAAGVAILPNPFYFEDEAEYRRILLPEERGQTFSVSAVATNEVGCPVPGGANVLTVQSSGDVADFNTLPPLFGRSVAQPGCPDAADAAVDVDFVWAGSTSSRLSISYDVSGPSGRGADLRIAGLDGRYAPQTAASGLQAVGTITRIATTCGPFQAGTFDFSATLLFNETDGLRIVNQDGSAFQGAEAPLGSWTFTSEGRSLGNGFSVQETILAGEIGYRRDGDGGISAIWDGLSRIDYFDEGTGAKVCDETATHVTSAEIPAFGFRYAF